MKSIKINTTFIIKRGGSIIIDNVFEFKFRGHSHKSVMKDSPKSPLMISVEYSEEDHYKETETYYRYDELPFIWRWKNYLFTVTDYEYGNFMEMKVSYDNYKK